ncbi:alkaline phosphatase [Bifidobacterium pullorum subsp. saeculare]|uniref:alkaline phosphatase n=1 Tax=Bifidobacterium pullorum TaxID=78448 RepID=UPI00195E13F0|nr:alkaline phosphatase [Bifidobacterium pullorum subsp. saeculare]
MNKHHVLKGTVAALVATAMLAGVSGMAYAADGKSAAEQLAGHGAAQRIAGMYGNQHAKNVILFIGDGMGDSEITVARDYLYGANGSFDGLDKIGQPSAYGDTTVGTGQYTTFSLGNGIQDKGNPTVTPVTDSAASGSAWATGTKTYNNALDVDVYGNPQLNLTELAKAAGKATGNVTTSEIQDATPAAQMSHSTLRSCYGPQGKTDGSSNNAADQCEVAQLKENGGIGSISEQMLDTRADVTIGGGAKYLHQVVQGGEYKGMTVWDQAKAMGYETVEKDVDALNALEYTGKPVLALMADGNLQTRFAPSVATKKDPAKDENPIQCAVNPDWLGNENANGNSASLADMTSKAIDLLEANEKGKENGFFLQVEGASIDKQDHNANACGQIGETDDLDKAISAALGKVDLSETLIIVTADHAHTSQIVEEQPNYALSTVLESPVDHAKITVSYGTSPDQMYANDDDPKFDEVESSMSHTGTQLRIAASGPGAQRVIGLTDQTDNFFTIANALGLKSTTEDMKTLSDGADANLVVDEKGQRVEFSGFDGDASVTYTVTDPTNGDAVIATSGEATDPVSGVRVRTDQTMSIDLTGKLTEGKTYRVTITGRQSGKVVVKDFQAPAAAAGDDSQVVPGETVENPGDNTSAAGQQTGVAGVLGKYGSAIAAVVVLIAALVSTALALKTVKGRRH